MLKHRHLTLPLKSTQKSISSKSAPNHQLQADTPAPYNKQAEQVFLAYPTALNLTPSVALHLQRQLGNHVLAQTIKKGGWVGYDQPAISRSKADDQKIQRAVPGTAHFIANMGAAPKGDGKSKRYQAIVVALNSYHAAVQQANTQHTFLRSRPLIELADERGPKWIEENAAFAINVVLQSLRNLVTACDTYLNTRSGKIVDAKQSLGKINPFSKPNAAKDAERRQKLTAITGLKTEANQAFGNNPAVQQLLPLRDYTKNLSGHFTDTKEQKDETRVLGKGVNNTAYAVKYNIPPNPFEGVFKAEPEGQHSDATESVGIPEQNTRGNYRAVAMYRLELLFQTGIIPRTEFAQKDGKFGQVMERAKGKSPLTAVAREGHEDDPSIVNVKRWMAEVKQLEGKKRLTVDDQENLEERKKQISRSEAQFVNGRWIVNEEKYINFDVRDPVLQQGLSNLHVIDIVSGQVDRHPGNYFIELAASGSVSKVTAIDNDLAFGKLHTNVSRPKAHLTALPEVADHSLAMRIVGDPNDANAGITADQVANAVQDLLTPAELAALRTRFTAVKEHLRGLIRNNQTASLPGAAAPIGAQQWGAGQVAGYDADRHAERSYMSRLNKEIKQRRPAGLLTEY